MKTNKIQWIVEYLKYTMEVVWLEGHQRVRAHVFCACRSEAAGATSYVVRTEPDPHMPLPGQRSAYVLSTYDWR